MVRKILGALLVLVLVGSGLAPSTAHDVEGGGGAIIATLIGAGPHAARATTDECDPTDPGEDVFFPLPPHCDDDGTPQSPQSEVFFPPVQDDAEENQPPAAECTLDVAFALSTAPSYGSDIYATATLVCSGVGVSYMKVRAMVQRKESGTWTTKAGKDAVHEPILPTGGTVSTNDDPAKFECASTAWRRYRARGRAEIVFDGNTYVWRAKEGPWIGRCKKP